MEHVLESKLLDFNLKKSCFIVIGNTKGKKKIRADLEASPLTLCGSKMKEVESEKLLGDFLDCRGNSHAIVTTLKKRYGQTIAAIIDIKKIVEDCRSKTVGGITAGIEIFQLCVIPYLLNNSETWDNIPREAFEILRKIQYFFYRCLLSTPRSTNVCSLLWETGGIKIELMILKRKLCFYHHLFNLEQSSLAYKIAKIQQTLTYPGLNND